LQKIQVGDSFGRLVVVGRAENSTGGTTRYLCKCVCGIETAVQHANLKSGNTKSCGCLHNEILAKMATRHGEANKTPEYSAWKAMIRRCETPSSSNYSIYGGRGITVCERWRHSYDNFLSDLGRKPSSVHSLDRTNVNGNYEPDNCKWSSPSEQSKNRRRFIVTAKEFEELMEYKRRYGPLTT
jgi:hypothetical protein